MLLIADGMFSYFKKKASILGAVPNCIIKQVYFLYSHLYSKWLYKVVILFLSNFSNGLVVQIRNLAIFLKINKAHNTSKKHLGEANCN